MHNTGIYIQCLVITYDRKESEKIIHIHIQIYIYTHTHIRRKATANLDSIVKSRDITLPTKVHIVKAMVFPVVMYGCESCAIKKAEC